MRTDVIISGSHNDNWRKIHEELEKLRARILDVSFNWRLIKAPTFVIDYVIVHELAHLLEPNHTVRFWGIVRTRAPGMEWARAWLREHGQLLEDLI